MICEHDLKKSPFHLQCIGAGHERYYYYINDHSQTLVYSSEITELIECFQRSKSLEISEKSLAFLLQSGVIPTPNTIFRDIFVLGIGDSISAEYFDQVVHVKHNHDFPYAKSKRGKVTPTKQVMEDLCKEIASFTRNKINKEKPTFLFHSAGKDSNSIAYSLFHYAPEIQPTLITLRSDLVKDESDISRMIANDLNYKHIVVDENVKTIDSYRSGQLQNFFRDMVFPNCDPVLLSYVDILENVPEIRGANVIDGMGNDIYIGHVSNFKELFGQAISLLIQPAIPILRKLVLSESPLRVFTRTRAEWVGMYGFSANDTQALLGGGADVFHDWKKQSNWNANYVDFRANIRGCQLDQDVFVGKVRAFSQVSNSKTVFPWMSETVAAHIMRIKSTYLFDRLKRKNKLILRSFLRQHLNLDSEAVGKVPFSFNTPKFVENNLSRIKHEIELCPLWKQPNTKNVLDRLVYSFPKKNRRSRRAKQLIFRLYLLTLWINHSNFSPFADANLT